jgi:hypothetical protein
VFPARYELNSYIVFRKRLVSKRLNKRGGPFARVELGEFYAHLLGNDIPTH